MCLTAVDIQYEGLLRPWLGYIMERKVPGLLAVAEAAFSVTQVDRFFFPCTAAFILLLQSGHLETKRAVFFSISLQTVLFFCFVF